MKIKIKGEEWKVEFVEKFSEYEECVLGLTKDNERKIYILKNQEEKFLKDTIAHELIHAYLFECGHYLSNVESEQVAHFVGRNFEQLLKNFETILKGAKNDRRKR